MVESLATMTPATSLPFGLQDLLDAFLKGMHDMATAAVTSGGAANAQSPTPILRLIAGDASDRKFFRLENTKQSAICMQFPKWEGGYGGDPLSWLGMHSALAAAGMPVPRVLHIDEPNCCIWTEDFGDDFLNAELPGDTLDAAEPTCAKTLSRYEGALELIVEAQYPRAPMPSHPALTRHFDFEKLHFEMRFFFAHFVRGFLALDATSDATSNASIAAVEAELTDLCRWLDARPRVLCHRDYHVRNVMIVDNALGWIDFQDARMGPHSYDVVSLVRDSYVRIDALTRERLYAHYVAACSERRVSLGLPPLDADDFAREVLRMGMQRNIKALGSFGYLAAEKRKPSYLRYVERTLETLVSKPSRGEGVEPAFADGYPATFDFLSSLLNGRLTPVLHERLARFLDP
jgi:aminoglycoside/choline kinase family phosphotransferase